jgi:hypothetical protein
MCDLNILNTCIETSVHFTELGCDTRSPLAVSGALRGLDGKKIEVPSTPHTIPDVSAE